MRIDDKWLILIVPMMFLTPYYLLFIQPSEAVQNTKFMDYLINDKFNITNGTAVLETYIKNDELSAINKQQEIKITELDARAYGKERFDSITWLAWLFAGMIILIIIIGLSLMKLQAMELDNKIKSKKLEDEKHYGRAKN